MQTRNFALDPRYFQVLFQLLFLMYGLLFLDWNLNLIHYALTIVCCLGFNYIFESFRQRQFLPLRAFAQWGFSVLISALSLCLLLKTNHQWVSLLASFITVASKYVFRIHHKHIFNPSAF